MKIKTNELKDAALDWAVARCENSDWSDEDCIVNVTTFDEYTGTICNYSTDWSQGGPIIEREKIGVGYTTDGGATWLAARADDPFYISGPTPLIAAMRCYVSSKLGDECDIPDELITGDYDDRTV